MSGGEIIMFIYYILPISWFLIYIFNRESSIKNYYGRGYKIEGSNSRRTVVLLSCIILFLIMGLRDTSVGTDTASYVREYMNYSSYRFSNIALSLQSEAGYSILQWIFAKAGVPWQGFLFVVSVFVSCSLGRFIYNYSANSFWGFYLYFTIGMFTMNMTGVRQSIAVAILLFAYDFALEKKIVLFVLLCLLAASIHYTAIAFIPMIIVLLVPFRSKKQLIIGLILPFFVRLFIGPVYHILSRFALRKYTFSGYFDSLNQSVNPLVEIVAFLILIACFVCLYFIQGEINVRDYHMFIFTGIYVACIEMSHAVFMSMRLSFYFIFFMTCLLGNIVYSFKDKKSRGLVMMAMLFLPFLQFILTVPGSSYGIDPYVFFWSK